MSDQTLEAEARYLHGLFFHREIDGAVMHRYVAANRLCFPVLSEKDTEILRVILTQQLDAEAIELAMRLKRGSDILTKKIQILFFLVEVRSDYYACFVNQTPGLWRAVPRLLGSCLQTAWKCVIGWYLIWRYGLV